MKTYILKILIALITYSLIQGSLLSAQTVRIGTWNIEHLGGAGRGLGGIGAGSLPPRTGKNLKQIAHFIKNTLKVDLIALQEISVTDRTNKLNISAALETITRHLGEDWSYHVGNSGRENQKPVHNLQNAFIWNSKKVRPVALFDLNFSNEFVGSKRLFDRTPLFGYFQVIKDGKDRNDFLLVNVHLTSGQHNDENHLAAMVILEQNIRLTLKQHGIKESDRIILGDFNDNPFAKDKKGKPKYSDLLYRYMNGKKYTNLVSAETGATRMDNKLKSIIDHILVNKSALRHLKYRTAKRYIPSLNRKKMAAWRKTYSDHFPLTFEIKVESRDDDVD